MKLLLVDNYDSFTYNLYHYLLQLGAGCLVMRNDEFEVEDLTTLGLDAIVLSPGPQRPAQAGRLLELIDRFYKQYPMLGICLGHQALGEYFGATLLKATQPMHGKTSEITHCGHGLFEAMTQPMQVMRYHSLSLKNLPPTLEGLAYTTKGELMAMRHRKWPLFGLQFHPESILTINGLDLLKNWLKMLKCIKKVRK